MFVIFDVRSLMFVPGERVTVAVSKSRMFSSKMMWRDFVEFFGWNVKLKSLPISGGEMMVPMN